MPFDTQTALNNRNLKNEERQKKSTIYSTKVINKILSDMKKGYQVDTNPFFMGKTDYRDSGIIFQYTQEEIEELQKCASDIVYFVSNYCKFKTQNGKRTVTLRDYQIDILHLFGDEVWDEETENIITKNRKIILLQSRQTGKTTTTAAYFVWYTLFHTDKNMMIVANKGRTANEIIKKVKDMYEGLPFFMKPGIVTLQATTIALENGCHIGSATTNPTSITGDSCNVLYMDEAAHIPTNISEEFWRSVYPTLSSFKDSQIIVSSTPKGKNNLFFRLYDKSCKGENDFINYKVYWYQVPGRDAAWEKAERNNFGSENFDQEYGLQFDVDATKLIRPYDFKLMRRIKKNFINLDLLTIEKKYSDKIFWNPECNPSTMTSQEMANSLFLFVIDTAEGKEVGVKGKKDSDWNIINIFKIELVSPIQLKKLGVDKEPKIKDCIQFKQIGLYMDNDNDEESAAQALKQIVYKTFRCGVGPIDNCRVLLEMNFNGKNFLNIFKDDNLFYDAIVLKTYHVKPVPGTPQKKKFGFKTTGGNGGKNYYCDLGAKMIARRQIIISQYNDFDINKSSIGQLENFGKNEKTGKYEGSCVHDDISVTVLFVSRAIEIDDFIMWVDDWIYNLNQYNTMEKDNNKRIYIQKLLNSASDIANDEPTMSDETFKMLYTPNTAPKIDEHILQIINANR